MRVLGTTVAGLSNIADLVPRLRSVGATHKMVGVQNMHYDILFRHLVGVIKEEVGPDKWDEATEDAWEQAFISVTDLIKRPSKRLETEPLRGWGVLILLSCTYFTLVTPFRFGGFYIGHPKVIVTLDVLDFCAAMVMFLDLTIDIIQTKFRVSKKKFINYTDTSDDENEAGGARKKTTSQGRRSVSLMLSIQSSWDHVSHRFITRNRKSVLKLLARYRMDRWVPWPALDIRVLASFVLQGIYVHSSLCSRLGLHWTQLFGLLRVSSASRALHFIQCAENNSLLGQTLDADRQLQIRIIKLLIRLAFITHV
jgi:hypothetical protein